MEHFDVIVIGAGISGISAAWHLQTRCPKKSFVILEGRASLGGTWDLFRYPGIRSDSDMYTLGYSFRPWTNPKAIADGPSILAYVKETAEAFGIDKKIRYDHRVTGARWKQDRWILSTSKGEFSCTFLFVCAGYYNYEAGYTPQLPGREKFQGRVVHPQFWTPDVAYEGKRVVVIGSGATAVTLVPELAKKAAHVVMLQRSPTYIVSMPEQDPVANFLRSKLPAAAAYAMTRFKNVAFGMAFYTWCRKRPEQAKRFLVNLVKRAVGDDVDVGTHFTPKYNPWDQRLCLVPDGDLFRAIKAGTAEVVTGHIETFTDKGIRLKSGKELEADLVVTATGLNLRLLGGLALDVDGVRVEPSKTMTYKGIMLSDVPNLAMAIGYTNASWTLKCDLTSEYVCRLINHMDKKGQHVCVPRRNDPKLQEEPLIDFSSGYVQRSLKDLPRQGSFMPWKLYQNYALDRMMLKRGKIEDGALQFL